MAISSISTTVSYLGDLFLQARRPNAFLRLAGAFSGRTMGEPFAYRETATREFPIGAFYTLPAPAQPAVLEGADAPTPRNTSLAQTTNVVQIFQEAVQVTYLAGSDRTISGVVAVAPGEAQGQVQNPRSTEYQIGRTLEKIAQDVNYTFLNGVFANPADPSATALKTRGILTAVSTNSLDKSADTNVDTAKYRGYVEALVQSMVQQNGYQIDETFALFAGVTEFNNVCAAYEAKGTLYLQPESEVAGIKVRRILTRFGTLLLTLDPDMPAQYFLVANMGTVGVVGLPVPGKGVLFEEPLGKRGASDQTQIYGQLGLDHGPEYLHGKCKVPVSIAL